MDKKPGNVNVVQIQDMTCPKTWIAVKVLKKLSLGQNIFYIYPVSKSLHQLLTSSKILMILTWSHWLILLNPPPSVPSASMTRLARSRTASGSSVTSDGNRSRSHTTEGNRSRSHTNEGSRARSHTDGAANNMDQSVPKSTEVSC